jgi:hypothetical protein
MIVIVSFLLIRFELNFGFRKIKTKFLDNFYYQKVQVATNKTF